MLAAKSVDTLGIEPSTPRNRFFRMLSGCDNQLHHVPLEKLERKLNMYYAFW